MEPLMIKIFIPRWVNEYFNHVGFMNLSYFSNC